MAVIGQNDNMRFALHLIFTLMTVAAITGGFAATSKAQEIRIATDLVITEVTVVGKDGDPVSGLTAGDFRLYDNSIERKIAFFQPVKGSRRPLSIVLALDVSGSMSPVEIGRLKDAVTTFFDGLSEYDAYISVISFAMEVKSEQSFTKRRDKLEKALTRLERNRDGLSTHAYDAIDFAVRQIEKKSPRAVRGTVPRRAVIIVTDGFPVGDVVTPDIVIERANAANVSVFNLILPSFARLRNGVTRVPTPLEMSGIALATGGKSLVSGTKSPHQLLAEIAEEITGSYAIAFYPDNATATEAPRRIRIESVHGYTVRQNRDSYTPRK